MIFLADAAYLRGSVYTDVSSAALLLAGSMILMTVALTAGSIMRDRRGIGFEGDIIPVVCVATVILLVIRAA